MDYDYDDGAKLFEKTLRLFHFASDRDETSHKVAQGIPHRLTELDFFLNLKKFTSNIAL